MKNLKLGASILLLCISFMGNSQKVKLKKGEVLVDEVVWLKYDGCGAFQSTCTILNSKGDELFFIKQFNIEGAKPITASNTKGTLSYDEVKFLGLKASAEFENETNRKILELLYKGKVVDANGELDQEMVARFVEKYGTPVSDRLNRNTNTNNTNTIIIKEEPRNGSGINVHLGR